MIKSSFFYRSVFFAVVSIIGCCTMNTVTANDYNIIPYPQHLSPQPGKFTFNKRTVILCVGKNAEIHKLAQQFSDQLLLVSGLKLAVNDFAADTTNAIIFKLKTGQTDSLESYTLNVSPKTIRITAASANGIFYGLQSMYQLLPAAIYGKQKVKIKNWSVPAVQIVDNPRFVYRGLHLDVSRHFFPIAFVKKYIDAMAIHKLNTFHWHLTDDQGWRIEIKKYPLLTKVGSKRVETLVGNYYENYPQRYDDEAHGGFYTQDEAREIVAYAKARYITVIPEIEMPGHAIAALASYPYLSCSRAPIKVATKWGIFKEVYCTRDSTFDFLENVLTEVIDIFPGKYIHIGGDECPKDSWRKCPDCQARIKSSGLKDENELQSYFIHRIEKFVNAHGRQIIGWDEILDGGLAPNATVMSWRGIRGGIAAAKAGHDVIMTPGGYCYLDKYQSDPVTEPVTIGGYTPLKKVYSYDPVPTELTADEAKHILGAQGNVWAEYIPNTERVEYMAFPRVSALSEIVWTQPAQLSWDRFRKNMPVEFERYAALNIKPSKVFYDIQYNSTYTTDGKVLVSLETDNVSSEIRYTIDGTTPTKKDKLYADTISLSESATLRAVAFVNGKKVSKEFSKAFIISKVTGLSYIQTPVNTWYRGDNVYSLTDGILGNTRSYSQWIAVGYSQDGEIVIDMKKESQISRFSVGFLIAPALCGYLPSKITVSTSTDGITYQEVATQEMTGRKTGTWEIYRPELIFPVTTARYVKLQLKNAGECLSSGEGGSQLFMDEVGVW